MFLKNGTCVYLAGLRFEYEYRSRAPRVTVYDAEKTHNEVATVAVERLTSRRELEELAAWWVFDNNFRAL